ncbi:MAG TPA: hypothetical protein VNG33_19785, partial [Polyangiaceae bacterium]|nr:hypothetical protein [Polyangiaceae bacterium]
MLAALVSGCTGTAPLPKPTAVPKAEAPAPAPKPAKERLLVLLRGIERPAPVLDLLPAEAQTALDTRLKTLAPEQREQLLHGELSQAVPLLHLKAGGSAGAALMALATTPVDTQELPLAFESSSPGSDAERLGKVKLAHDLAARAAQHFLRDRVLDLANARAADLLSLLQAIERVAVAAER